MGMRPGRCIYGSTGNQTWQPLSGSSHRPLASVGATPQSKGLMPPLCLSGLCLQAGGGRAGSTCFLLGPEGITPVPSPAAGQRLVWGTPLPDAHRSRLVPAAQNKVPPARASSSELWVPRPTVPLHIQRDPHQQSSDLCEGTSSLFSQGVEGQLL